jgi:SRSO17 transposase
VGGAKAWLIIDDTAMPKKGTNSVGVAPQYASTLGKQANCQTMVSVTLASGEVPVMLSLRLFLPDSWTGNEERMIKAGVPEEFRQAKTKPSSRSRRSTGSRLPACVSAVCWQTLAMACQPRSGRP